MRDRTLYIEIVQIDNNFQLHYNKFGAINMGNCENE